MACEITNEKVWLILENELPTSAQPLRMCESAASVKGFFRDTRWYIILILERLSWSFIHAYIHICIYFV